MTEMQDSKRTDASMITERLRSEIVSGALAPGSKLKLVPLAARYDVSRGPVREAASRLAAEGLIVIEDQRGFRVTPISRADLLDVTKEIAAKLQRQDDEFPCGSPQKGRRERGVSPSFLGSPVGL